MKFVSIIFTAAALALSCGSNANSAPVVELVAEFDAQVPQNVVFDKTVHDFGDVSVTDGPLSCSFTLTNKGEEPVAIYEVVSSCGCTDVKWTKGTLATGESGSISATYRNEDGAMPFDKTLTVYISGVKKPVVLRLRGVVHEKKKTLAELYGAEKIGNLGLKARMYKTSPLKQGLQVSETASVANLGKKPLSVGFADVSPHLEASVSPNPIPAGGVATLTFTITSSPDIYGKEVYSATPVLDGKKAAQSLQISAFTQENFTSLSKQERSDAPLPVFESSTVSFNTVDEGTVLDIEFKCTNKGKKTFHVFKADPELPALEAVAMPDIGPGKDGIYKFSLNTASFPKGECVIMVSLTTNSPLRPLVNLFVAGNIR